MGKRWTKKDIKFLCGQVDSFWLHNRMYHRPTAIKADLVARRAEIVIGGVRGFGAMLAERAESNASTAAHYRANPTFGGPDVVTRFDLLAAENRKEADKCAALVARLEAEGLPAEVASYLPQALEVSSFFSA